MNEETGQSLTFRVDNETDPQRITHIRDVQLPAGVLYTPPGLAPQTRMLSEEAVRIVAAAFQWAVESRRDADEE